MFTLADVDANVVKSGFFPLIMISDVTIELQIALSSHIGLFSSVVFHDYVEILFKIKL